MSFAEAYGADKPVHSTGHLGRRMKHRSHGGMKRSFHQNDNTFAHLPQMPGKQINQADQMTPVTTHIDRPTRFAIQ